MTRSSFGGSQYDWVFNRYQFGTQTLLALADGASLTFWNAKTGGSRYLDLIDSNGEPTTTITFTGYQTPRFEGPDGVLGMWADDGDNERHFMASVDAAAIAGAKAAVDAAAAEVALLKLQVDEALEGIDVAPASYP